MIKSVKEQIEKIEELSDDFFYEEHQTSTAEPFEKFEASIRRKELTFENKVQETANIKRLLCSSVSTMMQCYRCDDGPGAFYHLDFPFWATLKYLGQPS